MDKKLDNISSYKLFNRLEMSNVYQRLTRPLIIADNLRTPENMGSVLRLAANIGAEKVYFIKNDENKVRNWKIKKTASGAEEKIDWMFIEKENLNTFIPDDYEMIALETSGKATNIFKTKLPENIAFIIGHEVYGISKEMLNISSRIVYIPVPGVISSLNVTHALAIALFEWLRQCEWSN
jgi:tRNA G18 (ribose-2'-O)-methylase SpoU